IGGPATAALPGDASILSGAALGGTGTLGGRATAQSGGAISPGNSVGVLHVGSATFQAGSIFDLEVAPGEADELVVAGDAAITSGAKLRLFPEPGVYPLPGTGVFLPVLSAGSKTGLFDEPPPFAFLNVVVDQTGNQLQLNVQSNGTTAPTLDQTT